MNGAFGKPGHPFAGLATSARVHSADSSALHQEKGKQVSDSPQPSSLLRTDAARGQFLPECTLGALTIDKGLQGAAVFRWWLTVSGSAHPCPALPAVWSSPVTNIQEEAELC